MATRLVALLSFLSLFGAVASAQTDEIALSVGWSSFAGGRLGETIVIVPPVDVVTLDVNFDNGFRAGFRVTFNSWERFGHEVNYAYQRSARDVGGVDEGFGIHNYYYNLLAYASPRGSLVRPFVTGGVGASTIQNDNQFGFNFGGGLKLRLSERFGLRFDVRDHVSSKPEDFRVTEDPGRLHNVEYSAGFSLLF